MWAALAKVSKDVLFYMDSSIMDGKKRYRVSIIPKGEEVTITTGKNEKYCIWGHKGWIWDLPEEYVGEIIHVYSNF